jgi:hypothetical protein
LLRDTKWKARNRSFLRGGRLQFSLLISVYFKFDPHRMKTRNKFISFVTM